MDEDIEELRVQVRADTQGFRAEMAALRGNFDATLVEGFAGAGNVLERGLLSALRKGRLGFEDLRRTALGALGDIAAQAVQAGIGTGFAAPAGGGGLAQLLGGAAGALLGLPGRAAGGPVAPGSAYLVGERGPEVFVPTSAGRVEAAGGGKPRDVRVSIRLAAPRGSTAPVALQRSARQVASSVARALREW